MKLTSDEFIKQLKALATPSEENKTTNSSEDISIGVRMGQVFKLAKQYMAMPLNEVEKLLESNIHEARVGAVSIMDFQARDKKTPEEEKKKLFDLYIRRHDRINTWGMVDRSAIYVIGSYLMDKPHDILFQLAHSKHPMERRTAIVSCAYFIKNNQLDDTYQISELLMHDDNELVQNAAGWMLRFAGDKDQKRLLEFLDIHATKMPRPMLRNAIEKLNAQQKKHYLEAHKVNA